MGIVSFLIHQIQTNPLASAAVVASPVALLTYAIRNIPMFLYRKIKKSIFIDVRLIHGSSAYKDSLAYLTEKVIFERFSKSFTFNTLTEVTDYSVKSYKSVVTKRFVGIGFGTHVGFYKRHLVLVTRVDLSNQPGGHSNHRETIYCQFLFGSKRIVEQFGEDVRSYAETERDKSRSIEVYSNKEGEWNRVTNLKRRSLESIFLKGGVPEKIIAHLQQFEEKSQWSRERGLPNHTGILLSGPPGTCKTSLIHAIASQTNRMIYNLNLSSIGQEDQFTRLLSQEIDWNKIILAIEDIDATRASVESRNKDDTVATKLDPTVSLSTLLNSLDGLMSPDGLVVIATTNHKDKLDAALLRKGRFDLQIETQLCSKEEFFKMAKYFGYDPISYPHDFFHDMSGADLRALILEGGITRVADYQNDYHFNLGKLSHANS